MAYYCLHKFHKFPSEFVALERQEKAFVIASIQIKMEKDKAEEKKMKTKGKGRGKKR